MTLKSLNKMIKGGLVGLLATGGTLFALPMQGCDGLATELSTVLEEVISQLPTDEYVPPSDIPSGDNPSSDEYSDYNSYDEGFDGLGYF